MSIKEKRKLTREEKAQIREIIARAHKQGKQPATAQQTIPYDRIWPDGICLTNGTRYTKTLQFQDINYQLAQNEDKTAIFDGWCDFLNYFDSSIHFQLSFLNVAVGMDAFEQSISIPLQGDDFDSIREEYAVMLQNQLAKGNNGLVKTKFLTYGIEAETIKTAKPRLERIEIDILNNFKRLGVAADSLNGKERLQLLHSIFHMDTKEKFAFDWDWLPRSGLSTKDFIAPSGFEFRDGRRFRMGGKLGSFMEETFEPSFYARNAIRVNFASATAEWNISSKSSIPYNDVSAYTTYGTQRASAYRILEDTLNLRDVRIYDTVQDAEGKEKRVLNKNETTLAQQKQQAIKDAFRDWVWRDADRREALVNRYNVLFNSTRPREYSGEHITFSGMNPEISLRPHQSDAIAHILYGGNTLLAHEVGAGKTFEMVAAVMESKRLGLCQKALFAVPNHLTEQWAGEFLRLYPSANILVATKKDFETKNRKKFCARIATGDYDAIIMGHSQFEKIPVSRERQERLLQEEIDEIEDGITEMKSARAERFTIKQMESTKKQLEAKLKKLTDTEHKDNVVTFEQLGVDRLYVDEAHGFKNLFLYTKMRNVAGLSTTDAQKSSDMLMKCRYLDEITGSRGVVFATGTPVSNSMTELFTMMRYLQHDTLREKGLSHFDCWASTFGETSTAIELAPEGTGYRARTRFAKFFNLPELMTLFKEVADIKTADQLQLPTPEAVYHNVVAPPTEMQIGMVQELSERAAAVHSGTVDASVDNMLKITSDGRKLGLDQRIINPLLPDDPGSKVNQCVENIARIWQDGDADRLAQLVFCDLSTPKGDGSFTIYDDIRQKLIAKGIPENEIAFIHEANTEIRKKELFAKVRSGQVRVLMGSTSKMGAGTNVQDRLVALHDLDCPWRPGDLEQRKGRIVRQGNRNQKVHIFRYVTESTFDSYLWQTVENKQRFISQIMTSKSPVRSCEDVDETALSYAEIKALCAGNPMIKEKMDLDVDVARLKLLKANHQSQKYRMEDRLLKYFPEQIERSLGYIAGFQADIALAEKNVPIKGEFAGMEVLGRSLLEKEAAGTAILNACKTVKDMESIPLGHYRGFAMTLALENFGKDYVLTLKGQMSHKVALGTDPHGNILRIDNVLEQIPRRLEQARAALDDLFHQRDAAMLEIEKQFPQDVELLEKSARLAELDAALNMEAGASSLWWTAILPFLTGLSVSCGRNSLWSKATRRINLQYTHQWEKHASKLDPDHRPSPPNGRSRSDETRPGYSAHVLGHAGRTRADLPQNGAVGYR